MSDIKTVDGLEPWEIMRLASEGEPVAVCSIARQDVLIKADNPSWNWAKKLFFIIDISEPEMSWDFDWDFFNQYGGLPVVAENGTDYHAKCCKQVGINNSLRESPFYYWGGGKQPVPGNCEVEAITRYPESKHGGASSFDWSHRKLSDDIIGFKLTGKLRG